MPRFYDDHVPPFRNEPLTENLEVVPLDGCGEGLKTKKNVAKGDVVFAFTGKTLPFQTLFTLQVMPGFYVEDQLVMGKVLHSCDPNMDCDMETLQFTARRDIAAGEFLTMDYETTEDDLFRKFECICGSDNCRGRITGRANRA